MNVEAIRDDGKELRLVVNISDTDTTSDLGPSLLDALNAYWNRTDSAC